MFSDNEVIFDVVTRDALLVLDGKIYRLDGPFQSREHAHEAAEQVRNRITGSEPPSDLRVESVHLVQAAGSVSADGL